MAKLLKSDHECQERNDHRSDAGQDHKEEIEHDEFDDGFETSLLVKCSHGLVEIEKKNR